MTGALLLQLPIASTAGQHQRFVDALFTSSSAITTTGLTVVDTGTYYSLFGQLVIFALFQIGGLGYMVFIALAALIAGRQLSLRAGLTLQESIAGLARAEQRQFVKVVFWYTALFEGAGALLLTLHWLGQYSFPRALYLGIFHSVSAFCTAGFALFPASFMADRDNLLVNSTIALVTLAGAVGFFVLRDLDRYWRMVLTQRQSRRLSSHTKLVLVVTATMTVLGTAIVFFTEPTSIAGASPWQRFSSASFQALSAETTTGFNSIDITLMTPPGLLTIIILMFIGASPGGTGGGIKTTTFGAIVATVGGLLRGSEDAVVFRRRLTRDTVNRAFTIGVLSALIIIADCLLLSVTEAQTFLNILFEVVSAFATVGLSAGITPQLTTAGRLLIAVTMLIGRIGPLALGFALLARPREPRFRYAEDQLYIG